MTVTVSKPQKPTCTLPAVLLLLLHPSGNPSYAGYGASYCLNSCSAQQSPNGDVGVDGETQLHGLCSIGHQDLASEACLPS
jgi:hypothetical protein